MNADAHKQAVLDAHQRYAIARRRLKLLDEEREHWQKIHESARAQLDALTAEEP